MPDDVLVVERLVRATPDRVWEAWTTETGLAGWWWNHWPGTTYAVDLRVGGGYRIEAHDHGVGVRGDYLELDPPHRFVFSWVWLDGAEEGDRERVEVSFAAEGQDTRIVVVHSGPWTTAGPADAYRSGWVFVLDALAAESAQPGQRKA